MPSSRALGERATGAVPAGTRAILRLQSPHHPRFRMKSWAHALLGFSSCVSAKRLLIYQTRVEAPRAEQTLVLSEALAVTQWPACLLVLP